MWVNLGAPPQENSFYSLAEFRQKTQNGQDDQLLFTLENNFAGTTGQFMSLEFRGFTQFWVRINLDSLVGNWNLLIAEYNGGDKSAASSYKYFLNGVQLTGSPVNVGLTGEYPVNENRLGFDRSGVFSYNGLMDDVQIYNFDLTAAQARALVKEQTLTTFSGTATSFVRTSVPELSTWAMLVVGFAGLGVATYCRSRRTSVAAVSR
jgi:hypothetical protein